MVASTSSNKVFEALRVEDNARFSCLARDVTDANVLVVSDCGEVVADHEIGDLASDELFSQQRTGLPRPRPRLVHYRQPPHCATRTLPRPYDERNVAAAKEGRASQRLTREEDQKGPLGTFVLNETKNNNHFVCC